MSTAKEVVSIDRNGVSSDSNLSVEQQRQGINSFIQQYNQQIFELELNMDTLEVQQVPTDELESQRELMKAKKQNLLACRKRMQDRLNALPKK